jgi:hypothetical protein
MKKTVTMLAAAAAVVLSVSSSAQSFASDRGRELLVQAQSSYANRENSAEVERTLSLLADAEKNATDDDELMYEVLVMGSRTIYWKGNHQKTDAEKMAVFEKGMEKAKAAYALDDTLSEAYYFYAINLGKWALAKGVLASLFRKGELIEHAETAIKNETSTGAKGETTDGYGPNRTLGYLYYKLPGFAGGSNERALKYLSEAVNKAPTIALNHVYYAEVLSAGSASDKASARAILDNLLAQTPETFNPSRLPETREEFELARKLRADLR